MPVPATATRSPPARMLTRISSWKSSASETDFSSTTMPRSSAIVGAFTRLTSSSVRPWSAPPMTASMSMRVSYSAIRPRKAASMRSTELPSASDVEDAHALTHLRERVSIQPALGLGRLGQVHGDEVRLRVQLLAAGRLLDPELAVALGADERVERQHAHLKALRSVRHQLTDAAEAEDPERLLVQLNAREARALPAPARQRRVRLRDVARERQQQGHGVLGRGHDVGLRRVGDDDPTLGRGVDIDVVHAHTGSSDDAQRVRTLDQLAGQLGGRADHDPLELADPLSELLLVPVEPQLDLEVIAQELHAGPADVLPDEHARARRAVAFAAHR